MGEMSRKQSESNNGTVPSASGEGERRRGLRAIGRAASPLAGPIVARHGGSVLARLKADWPVVVGADLAIATWPQALARDGVLKLRVAAAVALELQHRAPLLIERINLYLGPPAITRLVLLQGPLPLPAPPRRAPSPPPSAEEADAIDPPLESVSDPELRAAPRLTDSIR